MHTHRSRNILFSSRRLWSVAAALLLAAGAAACAPDALLLPGDARLDGSVGEPITVTPDSVVLGDTGVVLTVRGSGFSETTMVWLDPWLSVTTTFVDDSTLTARIESPLFYAGTYQVAAYNEWWEPSQPATFVVGNPVPVITRMTPDWCETGGDCGTVTLDGRNFTYDTRVLWNGSDINVTYVSDTRLTFTLDPYSLQYPDLVQITALNPEPTAGASAPATFQVGTRYMLHTAGARVGSAAFELEIYGESFSPGDSVYWNGSPRATTVHNARRISAWIPASDVAAPGEGVITVRSGSVNMGQPFRVGTVTVRPTPSATVTSASSMYLSVRDVVYSPVTERLYATVYDGYDAGQVAVIDPAAGMVETFIWVGDSPRYLALTDDGRHLWVGVDGENRVRRLNLYYNYPDMEVALDSGVVAEDLAAVPGKPHQVAVARKTTCCSPRHAGVAVYDGWTGQPLSSATSAGIGSNVIEFGMRGGTLYGMDNETTDNRLRTLTVDNDGVTVASNGWDVGLDAYPDMVFAGGRLYTNQGPVIDTGYNDWAGYFSNTAGAVRPDLQTGRAFFLGDHFIQVMDINTFTVLGSLSISWPAFEHPANQRRHLVRWGTDGLAWHDADQLFLVRSPLVGP